MSDLRKQPLVRKQSTKFHSCYVGSLYVFGVLHIFGLFSYINILTTADSFYGVSVGTTLEPYATYFNLVIFSLVSNVIRIVLMFLSANKLSKFTEKGYMYNIALHIFAFIVNFLNGSLNAFDYENSNNMYLAGFVSALLTALIMTLPILIYYKKRKNMFFNETQEIYYNVIGNVPSEIKKYCESSRDTKDIYNYLSICVNVGTITQEQFNALNYFYVENSDKLQKENESRSVEESKSIATEDEQTIIDKTPTVNVAFCRKCGNRLIEDSIFCSSCGTRVVEREKSKKGFSILNAICIYKTKKQPLFYKITNYTTVFFMIASIVMVILANVFQDSRRNDFESIAPSVIYTILLIIFAIIGAFATMTNIKFKLSQAICSLVVMIGLIVSLVLLFIGNAAVISTEYYSLFHKQYISYTNSDMIMVFMELLLIIIVITVLLNIVAMFHQLFSYILKKLSRTKL